jgi:type VI secretion system secreted protein VgrG
MSPVVISEMQVMSQADRLGKLHTPFGEDVVVLLKFDGTEAVNELFEFTVEAMTGKEGLDLDSAIGKHCTIELKSIAHGPRYFDGLLTEVRALGFLEGGLGYRLTLRPWLWLLDQRRNQRIFHDKTAQDIIQTILAEHGFNADITASGLPQLEYTVQYGESDLAFIRRLMERFGLNFYFVHGNGSHDLKINDGSFDTPIPGDERVVLTSTGQHLGNEEHFDNWSFDRRITTGRVKLADYNFKTPAAAMGADQSGTASYDHHDLESYEYPGGYLDNGAGKTVAQLRLKQVRGADNRHRSEGDAMSLAAGMVVKLKSEDDALDGKSFVALGCTHSFVAESYSTGGSGGGGAGEDSYRGTYEFSPKDQPVVPPRVTARAVMSGPHVAVVTGSGEIDSDEFGRITVRFPWDSDGAMSMRCRVLQPWAGASFGNIFIPRVGMEVVVEFLDGDPDQPLVIGCLYNGQNAPPYGLPGKQNIAGIKSNSVGGGGYNEFILDDTGGSELIRTHAQYDLETTVENDERRTVKNNRTTEIDVNDTRTVKGNDKEDITGTMETTVSQSKQTDVSTTYDITAVSHFHVKVGQCELMMDGTQIVLSIGPSKVTLNMGQLSVESTAISITGSASLETKGGATAQHTAGGPMVIQAAIVNIN